jgi:8-oxo-dGTP diphosphatase
MDIIKVVSSIIYSGDKVFICRRNANKTLGGYWEFPGGKIEKEEKLELALEKELKDKL